MTVSVVIARAKSMGWCYVCVTSERAMVDTIDTPADLYELVANVRALPSAPDRAPTYFEVCGFPHYENVWSNVIEFFLDPGNEHALANLVLVSLLAQAGVDPETEDTTNVRVQREWTTQGGGRLDLLVETDTLVLGIENKVFAGVQNDLPDYERSLRALSARDGRRVLGILLSLEGNDADESGFFRVVTHAHVAQEIRTRLGDRLRDGTSRYLPLLLELLANIDRLTDGKTMIADVELARFISEHEAEITDVEQRLHRFREHLREQVKLVGAAIDVESVGVPCKQWFWRQKHGWSDTLVHDISLGSDLMIAINTVLEPSGWHFDVFHRNRPADYPIADRLRERGIESTLNEVFGDRVTWKRDPISFQAEPSEVASELTRLMGLIATLPAS